MPDRARAHFNRGVTGVLASHFVLSGLRNVVCGSEAASAPFRAFPGSETPDRVWDLAVEITELDNGLSRSMTMLPGPHGGGGVVTSANFTVAAQTAVVDFHVDLLDIGLYEVPGAIGARPLRVNESAPQPVFDMELGPRVDSTETSATLLVAKFEFDAPVIGFEPSRDFVAHGADFVQICPNLLTHSLRVNAVAVPNCTSSVPSVWPAYGQFHRTWLVLLQVAAPAAGDVRIVVRPFSQQNCAVSALDGSLVDQAWAGPDAASRCSMASPHVFANSTVRWAMNTTVYTVPLSTEFRTAATSASELIVPGQSVTLLTEVWATVRYSLPVRNVPTQAFTGLQGLTKLEGQLPVAVEAGTT
ncbi:hypothetical protein FNF27_04853 [Cafeteria roenbergensis]|uniref:Uncharacterized protein n=1 Tax=Cafeteria roenbergensis TaxID=33653 RepID=A0A5A8E7B9_CAFRO|nr:hypothetical protein FNF27_04853 [Cafeteria roenbergensis]